MSLKPAALFALFSIFILPIAFPQAVPAAATAKSAAATTNSDYASEGFVIEKYSTDITYAADGTGERLITVQIKIQSDAAVRQFGVLEFPYESRNEHLDYVYVRVRKPDGSILSTPDTEAQDQPAEVTRQAPFYSDIRNKQLPVKSLSVGDQLEYQVRQVRTVAAALGHFWFTQSFLKNVVVLDETISLTVPKSKYVQVESSDSKPDIKETGDNKVYRWKSSQLEKTKVPDEKKKPVVTEQPPSIAVTTFKNWEEVGHWYGDLQKDRIAVTPPIQAKAAELTKGLTTDEEKVAAIYTYVSTQYRYIGVAFGIGRYQPHSADDVMQNQYGDCKDKHTLLAALLKAAGYDAWPVLVGSQHVLQANVPSPGQFDHVMTAVTVRTGGVPTVWWLDSTPEVAPFRMLFSGLRDKEVLGIPNDSAPVLMKTPANPPFEAINHYEGKATLTSDGTLNAHFTISMRGDDELLFRIGFHQTPRVQWQTLVQQVSYGTGFAGTVSNIDASSPEQLAKPFQYSYDYTRKDFADWPNRRILPLIPPISFAYGGDDPKPAETILLGGPVTYTFHSSIQLPEGYTAELPAEAKQQKDFGEYLAKYSQTDGAVIVDRTFTWKQREIPVARWDEYQKFEKAVQDEAGAYIQLIGAGVKAGGQTASNPEAARLVQQAFADITSHSYDAAKRELDQAAKLNPDQEELWGGYGYLDISQNRVDDGIKKYQKELSLHPDRINMYRYLAGVQEFHKRPDDAVATLQALLKAAPDDAAGHNQLGALLMRQKRFADAVPVLEEAVKLSPDNANLKVMLGNAQISSGAKEKGSALLQDVLTNATDPLVLNDAAYALADANVELPLANASCRKALQQLDEKTSAISLNALSDDDLKQVVLLSATWDTMAWILYRQGDLARAEDYAKAAWTLDQRPDIAFHLGQIYEAGGKKAEAIHSYQQSIAASTRPDNAGVQGARDQLAKLGVEQMTTAQQGKVSEELSKMRTINFSISDKKKGSADFLVLFSPGNVEDAQFLRGDEVLKPAATLLKEAHFDVPFPAGSKAKILRRGIFYCAEVPRDCQFTMLPPGTTKRN